jgi:hypothetical protein
MKGEKKVKKYIIIGIISAVLLLSSVVIIISCAGEEAAAYIGTWVYEEAPDKAVLDIKESSFELMMYVDMGDGLEAKGEKQVWMPLRGFRGSMSVSDGVFSISLTEGYAYGYWFDYTEEPWPGLLNYIYMYFDAYANYEEATFQLSYSVSGNELTLSLVGAGSSEEVVFTKQ